jgi:hypothetical protein
MDDLVSLGTVVLAGVVHAGLQLGLGCLLLLYHESAGRHVGKKTRALVGSFVSGVGTIVFLALAATCFVVVNIFDGALSVEWLAAVVGVLVGLAVVVWFLYYRRGATTELWLPKVVAKFIDGRARVTESNTEAFSLGVLTCFAEAPFIFILLMVAGNSLLELPVKYQVLTVALYTIITMLPLIVMRVVLRNGRTVAEVQRWRVRNKMFLRVISGVGFFALAMYILAFKLLGGG